MKTTEDWLQEAIFKYENNELGALEDMIVITNNIMFQYKNDPKSRAAKSVFDSCIEHNTLFLKEVGIID